MKLSHLSFLVLFLTNICCHGQTSSGKFNLGFEKNTGSSPLPDGWMKWGSPDFLVQNDTAVTHSGNYASLISNMPEADENAFGSIAYRLPANYEGKKITLEGYMKIEDVKDGFVGLLLRIDGDGRSLAFDNMQQQNIQGTHDWKKYSITLSHFPEAKQIYVGGLLKGKGKAWFDSFQVSIDGKNIEELEPIEIEVPQAELDTTFDQGSAISMDELSEQQHQNLYNLGKVWGFVKYHHPEIAKGAINWDYELIRIMPEVLQASTDEQLQKTLINWIPPIDNLKTDKANSLTEQNPKLPADMKWIEDTQAGLNKTLSTIQKAEKPGDHYYIGFAPNIGNPIFKNEKPYREMDFDDDGFKLLGLFRYWNMIEYFFPYRHLMDEDWDNILKEFVPKAVQADDELSYKLMMLELIGKVQDTHANIWQRDNSLDDFFGKKTAPLAIKMTENQLVVTDIFPQFDSISGIQVGDIITKVEGKDASDLLTEKLKYSPASNKPTQLRDATRRLLRTNNDSLQLQVQREGQSLDKRIANIDYYTPGFWKKDLSSHKMLEGNIGYIYPGSLQKGEIDEIMPKFLQTKGLIIDMRCYPSDFIVFSLSKYLMPQPTEFVKFTGGSLENPGQFTFSPTLQVGQKNEVYYRGKVVIIVNEITQSQAEYTTMALRVAPDATVIGSTTAGADGNVSEIYLPGGVRTMISGIGVYYPDGTETQRVGIVPDIEIHPTLEGIRQGKDELLEKAISLINEYN